jgi:ATPase subunit of ABC transporter with duplicated ATPase domains
MTTPAATVTASADKPTDLRAVFDFRATPFTREVTTGDHLRLPFLDEAFASLLFAVESRMSAALIAPAGTGKTALLRRLRDADERAPGTAQLAVARDFAPVVGPHRGSPATPHRPSTTKGTPR